MIRVLVVDDSAFVRKAIALMLERAPDIQVAGTARDGEEALAQVRALDPDVVTLDVEMPGMDGLTALRHLIREAPRPVLMISSLTQEGAATTVEALAAGAFDFIPKEHARISTSITKIESELHQKVRQAARARRRPLRPAPGAAPPRPAPLRFPDARVLVVGISTGGPLALQALIPALPASFPVPIAIVQHMPPHFTRSLARRLDASSALDVREAEPGLALVPGRVVLARGGEHLTLRASARGTVEAVLSPEPAALLHRPAADELFRSAAEVYGRGVVALVMTGMGKDGLAGARHVRERGGHVLAQDEASCVVYGMPRAVAEAGLAEAAVPLDALAETLTAALGSRAAPAPANA